MLTKSELLRQVEQAAASRADIARVLSVAPARVTGLYAGKRDLSFDEARALIKHYHLEADQQHTSLDEIAAEHGLAFIEEIDLALGMGATYLSGGEPEVRGLVPFRAEWLKDIFRGSMQSLKVVRGSGDSMEPTIRNGDFVLIDTSHQRIDDQDVVWAVAYGELGMIRRVRSMPGGGYLLMPDNSVVRPIEAHDGEMVVLGKVIWIGRRM